MSGPTTNGDIYIAGQASETVTRVNLATGDREALITPCNPGGSSDLPGLDQVLLNEETDELLMLAARIYDYDLVSGSCSRLPGSGFFLKIANASADQLLAITFGSLMQIDRVTGEIVFVSK